MGEDTAVFGLCLLVGQLTGWLSFLWTVSSAFGLGRALNQTRICKTNNWPHSGSEWVSPLSTLCYCGKVARHAASPGFDVPKAPQLGYFQRRLPAPQYPCAPENATPNLHFTSRPDLEPLGRAQEGPRSRHALHMDCHVSDKSNLMASLLPSEQQIGIGKTVQPWGKDPTGQSQTAACRLGDCPQIHPYRH